MKCTLYETFTFSQTGNAGHYQGGDANLEEINKDAKNNVTNIGVPNEDQWTTVFRNLEKVKAVCNQYQFSYVVTTLVTWPIMNLYYILTPCPLNYF